MLPDENSFQSLCWLEGTPQASELSALEYAALATAIGASGLLLRSGVAGVVPRDRTKKYPPTPAAKTKTTTTTATIAPTGDDPPELPELSAESVVAAGIGKPVVPAAIAGVVVSAGAGECLSR